MLLKVKLTKFKFGSEVFFRVGYDLSLWHTKMAHIRLFLTFDRANVQDQPFQKWMLKR